MFFLFFFVHATSFGYNLFSSVLQIILKQKLRCVNRDKYVNRLRCSLLQLGDNRFSIRGCNYPRLCRGRRAHFGLCLCLYECVHCSLASKTKKSKLAFFVIIIFLLNYLSGERSAPGRLHLQNITRWIFGK